MDPLLRQRAQAQWEDTVRKPQELDGDLTPAAVDAMLHELQVHQIELEMQNEELKQSQLALEATKARYVDLYELAPVGYLTLSEAGLILECNFTAASMLGVLRGGVIKKAFSQLIAKEDQDAWYLLRKKAAVTHEQINVEMRLVRLDGLPFWCVASAASVRDGLGAITTRVTLTDISERMLAGEKLRESEVRRKVATDSGRVGIWEVNTKTNRLIWDDNCFVLYQLPREDSKGRFEEWARAIHPQDLDSVLQAFQNAMSGTSNYDLAFRIVWPDCSIRYMHARGEVLRDSAGIADRMIGTIWDITEQKLNEERLRTLVSEKEALLKEVHHRVKNNLQVITSLLSLEARRSAADHTREVLVDMQARIRAMALLHESLYRSGTLASIDLGSYLRQLSIQAFRTQSTHSGAVQLKPELGSVQVGMDQAVACGLLVNELISNCLKHAFPDGNTGYVNIELLPVDAQRQWCLRVSDTGAGLPENFEEKRMNSLGMQLAGDLARQIGGELRIASNQDKGVSFSVDFKASEPAPLVMPT